MIPDSIIIALGILFATIFIRNLVAGEAWGKLKSHPADRKNNPRRYWLVQGIIGLAALYILYVGFFTK